MSQADGRELLDDRNQYLQTENAELKEKLVRTK